MSLQLHSMLVDVQVAYSQRLGKVVGYTGQTSPKVEYAPSTGAGGGTRYCSARFFSAESGSSPEARRSRFSFVKCL